MANEQTSVPLYAASEILTAANMNISAGTGVPVFATTVTRDAAFGGAGEKVLAEGQLCYLSASNIVQQYNGSGWETVGPAAASALTLVRSQTIGSAVSSVQVTGAFNSSYANYFITINGGVASTNSASRLTFGATAAGYYYGANYVSYSGSGGVFNGSNVGYVDNAIYNSANGISMNLFVQSPNVAARTLFQFNTAGATTSSVFLSSRGGGWVDNATQYTTFTLTADSGTLTGGDILVYGYANS